MGKTFVTCLLTRQLIASGEKVRAIKPVISGFSEPSTSDSGLLLAAQNLSSHDLEKISPWRFAAPISPHAADSEKTISLDKLTAFCQPKTQEILLIEGAGGIMTPLTDHATNLDWANELNAQIILVIGDYLGTLSHTLTAIEAIKTRNLPIAAVIINQFTASSQPKQSNQSLISLFFSQHFPLSSRRRAGSMPNHELFSQLIDMDPALRRDDNKEFGEKNIPDKFTNTRQTLQTFHPQIKFMLLPKATKNVKLPDLTGICT